MFRSVLHLKPGPAGDGAIVDHYVRHQVLLKALRDGGCLQAELQVRLPDRDEVVVSALWSSAADYEQWTASGTRRSETAPLEELLAPDSLPLGAGALYEVVAAVPEGAP